MPRGQNKKAIKDYMNEVGGVSEDEFESYYSYSLMKEESSGEAMREL